MLSEKSKLVGGIVCSLFSIIGTVLNSVCLIVLLRDRKLRSHPTTILVISLTSLDLFYSVIIFPSLAFHYLNCGFCYPWSTYCTLLAFLVFWNHGTLIHIQAALAMNRWAAVCTNFRITPRASLFAIFWCFLFNTSLLIAPAFGAAGHLGYDVTSETCTIWSSQDSFDPNALILSTGMGIPYTVILVCYSVILKTIRRTNRRIEEQANCMRSRLSVVPESDSRVVQSNVRIRPQTLAVPRDTVSLPPGSVGATPDHLGPMSSQSTPSNKGPGQENFDIIQPAKSNLSNLSGIFHRKKTTGLNTMVHPIPRIVETECSTRGQHQGRSMSLIVSEVDGAAYNQLQSLRDILHEQTTTSTLSEEAVSSSLKYILKNERPDTFSSSFSDRTGTGTQSNSGQPRINGTFSASFANSLNRSRVSYVEDLERQYTLKRQKRSRQELNLTFTVGVILVASLVCNLPGVIVKGVDSSVVKYPQVHMPVYIFAWMSVLINPLVYVVCNPSYRSAFKRFITGS